MAFGDSRLTLYALLSAIETDLRRMIVLDLDGQESLEGLLTKDLLDRCYERMEADIGGRLQDASLADVLEYVDFGDTLQILHRHRNALPPAHLEILKSETSKLEKLIPIRHRVAHVRPLRFEDLSLTFETTRALSTSNREAWSKVTDMLDKLERDPSFVLGLEIPSVVEDPKAGRHNLPAPDFDETGFIGREEQIKQLLGLCLGPYPVITIVGAGGVGKTAIALKVAYDLLDLPQAPFDAIVWASSKTTRLTATDIVEIDGAIRDSLGMLERVADQLAGVRDENMIDEIVSYLREFKILLVLDNLETVLDDRIRDFLSRLPAGSKILTTSRIGLGAYEFPVRLDGLKGPEAVQLLRAVATVRGEKELVKMPNARLEKFCEKMAYNPGFIKWFVSAVQVGRRPEEVLARPHIFLDFCMSNVYDYLSADSRRTLMAMQCLPGRHSQAELAYLLDVDDVLTLQRTLQQLLTTNMVRMYTVPVGATYSSRYEVAEMARSYLAKHHPPGSEEVKLFNKRKLQLRSVGTLVRSDNDISRYNIKSLRTRSASDTIIAKYLRDALARAKGGEYQQAETLVQKAKQLAPEYFEVHRVEGLVKALAGDIAGAQAAYEAAVNIEPDWPPLRLWYGGFLMRHLDDQEGALSQFEQGLKMDPTAYDLQVERARAHLYLKQFKEAEEGIQALVQGKSLSAWQQKKVYDLYLQSRYRWAEFLLEGHDSHGALRLMEEMRRLYETCPKHILDATMVDHVSKAGYIAARLCQVWKSGTGDFQRAADLLRWLVVATGTSGYVVKVTRDTKPSISIEQVDQAHLEAPPVCSRVSRRME